MPAHVRLDHTDAEFVDVIHTDGKGIIFLGKCILSYIFLMMTIIKCILVRVIIKIRYFQISLTSITQRER